MFRAFPLRILKDDMWVKVLTLGVILLFILLADAILSFWVPNFLQDTYGSSLVMGLVMSFSSVVGFLSDLYFPQMLRGITVKRLILLGIISSFFFALLLLQSTFFPFVVVILLAMAVWGIYYEFIGFGEQQFIADSTPLKSHSSAWGVMSVFRSMAYFLGPILAGLLISQGERTPLVFAMVLMAIGFLILLLTRSKHERSIEIETHEVSMFRELSHWKALFTHVWPVVTLSLFMGLIDATFWTTGATWSQTLSKQSFWGGLFLPFYTLPSLFMGFVVAKWGVAEGKKKKAIQFLLFSGVFLALLGVSGSIVNQLVFVLIASILLSAAFPLTDAIYSDIVSRMGRERRHLIGLSRSTISLAYIVGPILSGFIASQVGEKLTFGIVGLMVIVVSVVLLISTPKKLKLPQEEIQAWE